MRAYATYSEYLEDMFFTLKIMMMDALMRGEEFLYRFAFSTDEKPVIFAGIVACASTPFAKSGDVVHEFLFLEKIKYSVDCHSIYRELFCDFIGRKSTVIFFQKREYFLTCFCLSHERHFSNKISNATLLHYIKL
jgi:hypothetical protein